MSERIETAQRIIQAAPKHPSELWGKATKESKFIMLDHEDHFAIVFKNPKAPGQREVRLVQEHSPAKGTLRKMG